MHQCSPPPPHWHLPQIFQFYFFAHVQNLIFRVRAAFKTGANPGGYAVGAAPLPLAFWPAPGGGGGVIR